VGNVVNDTKEHLRTALETTATQHACFMEEVRSSYQSELSQSANLRREVEDFVSGIKVNTQSVEHRVQDAAVKAEKLLVEQKDVSEELEKRRKRDRTSLDLEIKSIQKRMGGIFDSHEAVMKGFEHLVDVVGMLLDASRMQCAFNLQDTADREHMFLLGLQDEGGPKESLGAQTPPKPKGQLIQGSPRRPKKAQQIVNVDQRCLSCSGQAPNVLSAFKMACLQYNPSPVTFEETELNRLDILNKIDGTLKRAQSQYSSGPNRKAIPGGQEGGTFSVADYVPMVVSAAKDSSRLPTLRSGGPNNGPQTRRLDFIE
jgi:hypothetical protein